ncbi:MAG: adenylate/guanylate cyclase domain-containing protein [Gammaproteobacteria bacterium]|nr:adenylate/guanylate cyclase domain-containing protein [Gammaproteobacteria bacterium]MBU1645618.1 adenylate/guanylate cyclase domain-containing protein [Gammaproteobacteria bacterium]MBU1973580.1 adenylate/guanylate cyclase domain-containing protein [Gammaproteobacteria bacterium]
MSEPARFLCVLFADVAGSTRLYERLGDAEALHAVERCLNRVDRVVATYKGRVIKTIGDEIMAVFDSAEEGMQAACDMQQRVEDLPPVSGVKLSIRIGYHYGTAIEERNDVFGDTVNLAARMTSLAKGGQIITTGEAIDALPPLLRQSTREIDAIAIKGKAEVVRVCEVLWQEGDDLTMKSASIAPVAPPPLRLKLRHGNKEVTLDAAHPSATLGRDLASDVVIADPRASRSHAHIALRRDKFMLVDQSTNGTYVTFQGEAEFVLKREETFLRGRGRVSFGHAWSADKAEVLEFEILGN